MTQLKDLRVGSTVYTDYYHRVDKQEETEFGHLTHLKNIKTGETETLRSSDLKFKLIVKL